MTTFGNLYVKASDIPAEHTKPFLDGSRWLIDGEIRQWTGDSSPVYSPILDENGNKYEIGSYPSMTKKEALEAVDAAHAGKNCSPVDLVGFTNRYCLSCQPLAVGQVSGQR